MNTAIIPPRSARHPARAPGFGPGQAVLSWLGASAPADVLAALRRRGWHVRQVASAAFSPASPDDEATVLVVEIGEATADRALATAEDWLHGEPGRHLVVLLDSASEAHRRWAGRLTPLCWPWPLPAEHAADLLDHVRLALAAGGRRLRLREVVLTLGESVVVDGAHVPLGVAERNFLYELASAPGLRISKTDEVAGERGRPIEAVECRRRLGRKLGAELAELLVPTLRGEPYRFREADEVTAVTADPSAGHAPTRLRVVGRASIRAGWSREAAALLA